MENKKKVEEWSSTDARVASSKQILTTYFGIKLFFLKFGV